MNTAVANPAAADLDQPAMPAVGDYLTVVVRRGRVILIPFALITLAAAAVAFVLPPTYVERTTVRVADPEVVGSFFSQIGLPVPHKQILTTIKNEISAVSFLEPLIDKVDITEGYNRHDRRQFEKLVTTVKGNLTVNLVAQKIGDDIFFVEYRGREARKVAEFVNEIRDKYNDYFMTRYRGDIQDAWKHVKGLKENAEKELRVSTDALKTFQDTYGAMFVGDTSDLGSQLRGQLGKTTDDLALFEGQLQGQKQALLEIESKLAITSPLKDGGSAQTPNPAWVQQKGVVDQLVLRLEALAKRATEAHPEYIAVKAGLEDAKLTLSQLPQFDAGPKNPVPNPEYDKLIDQQRNARFDINRLEPAIAAAKARLAQLDKDMKDLPEHLKRAGELAVRKSAATLQFEKAQRQFAIVDATKERALRRETTFFKVIDAPSPEAAKDKDPVAPNIPLFIGVGAFVGLIVGLGLAFIREFTTPAFTTANQVRFGLSLPVLGEIAPLKTTGQAAESRRKKALIATLLVVLFGAVGWFHVAYFSTRWRSSLPQPVFEVMRKVYGKV
jgi:uncharacterized protein involved in exopolysaccharide biosynthesis